GNEALPGMARYSGRHDGRATNGDEVWEFVSWRRRLVMHFDFATAGRILFGVGKAAEAKAAVASMGRRPLVGCRASPGRAEALGLDGPLFPNPGEPTVEAVRHGVAFARREECDVVVGIGGGSSVDLAKAIASILGNGGDPLDYLEVVGKGQP